MNSSILSMKVILISAGVVSLAAALKFSIPIAVNEVPTMWSIVLSWMKPPYLYIIINGIIITIAASSRFHQSQPEPPPAVRSDHSISFKAPPVATFESLSIQPEIFSTVEESAVAAVQEEIVVSEIQDRIVELNPVMVNGSMVDIVTEENNLVPTEVDGEAARDVFVDSTMTYNTLPLEISSPEVQFESLFPVREKPLASSRFVHRKPNRTIRSIPEVPSMKALRVAKPKKQETLESTWKMITEGRHVPLTRHLKKSDTWEHHAPPAVNHVPKSETFKERSNYRSPPAKIRKDPSLSQEELNRRVEAFINKVNEEMRMQRQESLNQYMEMINRGV